MNIEGPKSEAEVAKQIITLSTGAVALTVTFLEKFSASDSANVLSWLKGPYLSWLLFGLTIAFALWYLMALNGTIVAIGRKENGWEMTEAQKRAADGDDNHTKLPGLLMIAFFFLAVVALIISR